MHSFIPHKNNPHTVRKFFGGLFLLLLSISVVYFGKNYLQITSKAQIQQLISSQQEQVAVETPASPKTDIIPDNSQTENNQQQNLATIITDSDKMATTIEEAKAPVPAGPRSKDPKIALEEAKTYARPQIMTGKYIDVSLSYQNMVLFEDGNFVDAYLISSGKRGMETPQGTFQIQNKVPRAWSKRYGLYMPNWMALVPSGEFGIHELPEWPGGYKEGANHLGVPVSHGCVRLGVGPAKRVYDWAQVGTTVIVHK